MQVVKRINLAGSGDRKDTPFIWKRRDVLVSRQDKPRQKTVATHRQGHTDRSMLRSRLRQWTILTASSLVWLDANNGTTYRQQKRDTYVSKVKTGDRG